MATLDEVISQMSEEDYFSDPIQFVIDNDLRIVSVPDRGVVAGVVGDKNVNRINFQMPRYYNGFDMSKFKTRINYVNAKGKPNYYAVTDLTIKDDLLIFSWLVDADVVAYVGTVSFSVNMVLTGDDGVTKQAFNTSNVEKLKALEGIQVDKHISYEEQVDLISKLEADLTKYISSGINQIQDEGAKVKKSLPEDYVKMTEDVTSLKEDIGNISNDINPLTWNDGFMLQNGEAVAAEGRSVSDFCLCPAESQVEYVSETTNQYVQGIVFYDINRTSIIGYSNNGKEGEPCTVISPKNTYYHRLSVTNNNLKKAYFKCSKPVVKSFIEKNSNRQITAQDTDFAEIEVTNYMLICDIIKNKAYIVNNNIYSGLKDDENRDSSTLCILDRTKDMYSGNRYNTDVIFFDSDRKFISSTNALTIGTKLAKEQYPSNAKYVAFTWWSKGDGVIADKMYVSTVDNDWNTGLPALKYGKTIKYKGQRPIINIYNSDTQEEIFDKLADACYTQDCDVYFEKGTYVFDTIYDKIKTYYNSVGDAFEMLLGGNCRYYMYGCTFKGDFTNSTGKQSTFGSHRHAGSYELFGGTIICVDGVYCVHDEQSGEEPLSVRKYHHVTFKYVKGSTYSNWICKCLGCGTGKNTITIIDGCYFESDNDLCEAEASWHGNLEDESACETFIEVKNSYFKDKGFYVDAIPSGSKQIGKIIFCNNSVKNKLPTESNGWIFAGWNNEVRSAN